MSETTNLKKVLKKVLKFILSIIKFIFKEIASFFIKFILFLFVIAIISSAIIQSTMGNFEKKVIRSGTILKVDLSNEYQDGGTIPYGFLYEGNMNFYSLLSTLEFAQTDPKIKGVLLELDNINLDNAQIEELSKTITNIKGEGKTVYSYATSLNNKNYKLAVSSNEIIMPPTATTGVNIIGYYSELNYYKKLINYLGIDVNVIHVGDYKTYGETFVREKMSRENREDITRLKDKMYDLFLNKVSNMRKKEREDLNKSILNGELVGIDSEDMLKLGLIDKLQYEFEFINEYGKNRVVDIYEYKDTINDNKRATDKIAILYINGAILQDSSDDKIIDTGVTPAYVKDQIEKIKKDKNIKAVVLRINSPGGSALAANLITAELNQLKSKMPIYVSIGGVAASGGYYIATVGDKIYADKSSITGSIGVVSLIPNFEKLVKNIGINVETVQKGKYADMYSLTKKFTKDDEEKIYNSSVKVYKEFVNIVAKSRGRSYDEINNIAQGKVWLGEEGVQIGLVDEIGGLETVISDIAEKQKMENYKVVEMLDKQKIDSVIRKYIPFYSKISAVEKTMDAQFDKNMYFTPLYLFPYDIQ